VTRLSGGILRFFELRILFRSNYKQDDSSYQRYSAERRRNGNAVMFFGSGMDRTDVQYFFLMSIIKALIPKAQRAQHDKEKSGPHDWFHSLFSISDRFSLAGFTP
jgi:hypothetical protein